VNPAGTACVANNECANGTCQSASDTCN
jgi:hypothetical protein